MSKNRLLEILEENKGTILSGNDLSGLLSISRNAVWKGINSLKEQGHQIESIKNKGYVLHLDSDSLSRSEIARNVRDSTLNYEIIILDEIPSTNTYLKEHKDLVNNTLVLAKTQTKGRGRLGKSFHSLDQGGIYMSLLKTEDITDYDTALATLASALAVSEVLDEYLEAATSIKWVNDIYHGGLKLAGILTEGTLEFETGSLSSLIIGIGINVNTEEFPEELSSIATSIYRITGKKHVRSEIIGKILSSLEKHLRMTRTNPEELILAYRKKMLYLGEEILVIRGEEKIQGTLQDITGKGHLILKTGSETLTLNSGEISIRKREI